jgi:hypothetical protein
MKQLLSIIALLLLFGCAAPQPMPPAALGPTKPMTLGGRVVVQVPAGVEATGSDPRMDFLVTQFTRNGKPLMMLYLGNHPDPRFSTHEEPLDLGGLKGARHLEPKDGKLTCEALIDLPGASWAQKAHVLWRDLGPDDALAADSMLFSLTLVPPKE